MQVNQQRRARPSHAGGAELSLLRTHIGGVRPPRPTLTRAALSVSSGCFVAAPMKILAPGLSSLFSAGTKVTIGASGGTITVFSPSLYFSVSVAPSTRVTMLATVALVMVLCGTRSQR